MLPPITRSSDWNAWSSRIEQGEVWWGNLPPPWGSGPGYRRPVVIVQGNALNRTRISTAVVVPLTTNLNLARALGNVLLVANGNGLSEDSVANVSQIFTLDRRALERRLGRVNEDELELILRGIDVVLGR